MLTRGSHIGADSSLMDSLPIGLTMDCSGSRFLMFCVIVIVLYHYFIMIRDVSGHKNATFLVYRLLCSAGDDTYCSSARTAQ